MSGSPSIDSTAVLERGFRPKSIALVGASDNSIWSTWIHANIARFDYGGSVYVINRRGVPAHGIPGHASARDIPEKIDAAYVFVPAEAVIGAVEDLASAGVHFVVVLTSGFAESGPDGALLQQRLLQRAAELNVLILGPNCYGFVNVAARAPLSPAIPPPFPLLPGHVGLICQSGMTSMDLWKFAEQQHIGLSFYTATGNEAAVDISQIVEFLIDDPQTRAIAIFTESIRHPDRFAAAAERARRARKPIVILKIGGSEIAAEVARAHTGSLVGDDRVFDAACRRLGLIRVSSGEDLMLTAGFLAHTGPLQAPGVGFSSVSGGACTLIAARAEAAGVPLPKWSESTVAALREVLPDWAMTLNPLDLTGASQKSRNLLEDSLTVMARDPQMGLLGAVFQIPDDDDRFLDDFYASIGRAVRAVKTPCVLITTVMKTLNVHARAKIREFGLPFVFTSIDHAVRAIGRAVWWSGQLSIQRSALPARAALPRSGDRPRHERAILDQLQALGIPVVPASVARSVADAVAAARKHPQGVVLKVLSVDIAHKTDVGGVRLSLHGDEAVQRAYEEISNNVRRARPDARIEGIVVSPMRRGGIELIVGIARDPQWGLVLAVGLGGVWVEVMGDTALSLLPVDTQDVKAMLMGLKAAPLLRGHRGAPPVDLDRLAQTVVKIADAARSYGDELMSLEINPLSVSAERIEALDAVLVWKAGSESAGPDA